MATWIQALSAYRPRIVGAVTVGLDEVAEYLAVGTLVTRPLARMVLDELGRIVLLQLRAGKKVRLPGIGVFGVEVRMDGTLYPTVRLAQELRDGLEDVDGFQGKIQHRDAIGMDMAALKERWDGEHPGDALELPTAGRGAALKGARASATAHGRPAKAARARAAADAGNAHVVAEAGGVVGEG